MKNNLWSRLVSRSNDDLPVTVDDWAKMMSFNGNGYMLNRNARVGTNEESIGTDFESYVTQAYQKNGIVFACMVARMLVFSEAVFRFQVVRNGKFGELVHHPNLNILDNPWPGGFTGDLLNRAIQDADLAGTHYALETGFGSNKRIRRLRPDWVNIILSKPESEAGKDDILGHVYRPGGTTDPDKYDIYPADGSKGIIAMWAPIPDPLAQYRGMSWLTPVIREIEADKAATDHKGKFFSNAATPNLFVSFKESVTKEQFEEFVGVMNAEKHGVEHAYETLYMGGGADVTVIGKDLAQMDFKVTQGAGETRIAAAARIHPVIVGLSEGMQGSSLNSGNYQAAKRSFADGTMRPLWRSIAGAYSTLAVPPTGHRLWFDTSDVAFLREDVKDLAEIQKIEATTITQFTREGFTWESAVAATVAQDWSLLKHTGLYSVQLQKPDTTANVSKDVKKDEPKKDNVE